MASATISWSLDQTSNVTSQTVYVKPTSNSTWPQSGTNVPVGTKTLTLNNLTDNVSYDYQVVSICAEGGPVPSAKRTAAKVTCTGAVSLVETDTRISYSFAHLGGSINRYEVRLLSATDMQIGIHTVVQVGGVIPSTISNQFTGLAPSTSYKVQIKVFIDGVDSGSSFSKQDCAAIAITTKPTPSCPIPSITTVTFA